MKKRSNPLWKETLRTIWQTRTRFLSLVAIVALGCGFFAGLKATSPDMKLTADNYFADTRLMDLHLMSTFGLNDEDIAAVREVEGIRGFAAGYSADLLLRTDEAAQTVVKVYSLPEGEESDENYLNRPLLLEGRLPEQSGECVIDKNFNSGLSANGQVEIGDTITLLSGSTDADIADTLARDTFTVVGIVQSPLYIGFERGHSTIGDGEVDAYLMIPEEDFTLEVYTDAYLTLESTAGLSAFSSDYETSVDEAIDRFEEVAARRGEERYNEIYEEAQAEIDDAKAELADAEQERDEALAEAEQELADAEAELAQGRRDYEDGLATYNQEIREAEEQLADGEQQLADAENAYEEALAEYEQGRSDYEAALPEAQAQLADYREQLAQLQEQAGPAIAQVDSARGLLTSVEALVQSFAERSVPSIEAAEASEQQVITAADGLLAVLPEDSVPQGTSLTGLLTEYISARQSQKDYLSRQIGALTGTIETALDAQDEALAEARSGIEQLTAGIAEGEQQLADTLAELDAAEAQLAETRTLLDEQDETLSQGWQDLARERSSGREELEAARIELEDGEAQLAEARAEYETEKADSAQEIEDARAEIAQAEQDLADLGEPTWYVWDRDNNPDYSSYAEDTEKVDAVAAVFPVFFILVAALVCLTTMTRMVEEQRTQIGTFKALGYGRGAIMAKYIGYAAAASVIGAAVGLAIGFKLFPYVIINAYRIMYEIPNAVAPIRWGLAGACMAVALLCMCLTTFAACAKQTDEVPSQLMRPKAPKNGKRVLLERIGFIWKRLNFSKKVTVRNLFRYKRRVLMTIVGIAGCTALLLTGFGLRYAISSIGDKQYERVFVYDTTVTLDDKLTASELADYAEALSGVEGVAESMPAASRSIDVRGENKIVSITLMVPQDPEQMGSYIDLHERVSGEKLSLSDDGVIINEKLSRLLDVKEGDSITLVNPNGRPVPVTVLGISENYALNYVYMTPALYRQEFRETPVYSTVLLNQEEGVSESTLSEEILALGDGVLAVTHTSGIAGTFDAMLGSLNAIVWVIIISAGLLAFVVLYNLANINVNERVRELATIKVLGFYDGEVTGYITRENNISAFFGIAIGLVLGIALERFVIRTAEVDAVMFAPDIAWYCFVFAGLLTALFTLIVDLVLHFQLKKIDMVESLKSVE